MFSSMLIQSIARILLSFLHPLEANDQETGFLHMESQLAPILQLE
jgi:hypothetical protein